MVQQSNALSQLTPEGVQLRDQLFQNKLQCDFLNLYGLVTVTTENNGVALDKTKYQDNYKRNVQMITLSVCSGTSNLATCWGCWSH